MVSGKYNMTAFYLGDIYIIVTAIDGSDDFEIYRFHYVGPNYQFTKHALAGAPTSLKFTVSTFLENKIILGGNPIYPANIVFSQTAIAATAIATPDNWIDFTTYDAGSQIVGNSRY